MLRFVRSVGAWPGRVVVVACEPAEVEELGIGLSDRVEAAVQGAVDLVLATTADLRAQAAATAG
jgi:Ni,Fe-hydrogenase maturation factor